MSTQLPLFGERLQVPYHFEFDSKNQVVRCRFEGLISDESLKECYGLVGKYVVLTASRAGIMDLSEVTSLEVSSETIRELANLPPAIANSNLPRIVVAPATQVFGLARMFELAGQDTRPNLHVVRSLREAYVILGIQNPVWRPVEDGA